MMLFYSISLFTPLLALLVEFAVASHEIDHSTTAFPTLNVSPTLSCPSLTYSSSSTCPTILPGLFPPGEFHWNSTNGVPRSLPTGIVRNNTHHWPGRVSNTSHDHGWPSSSTLPSVTARPSSTFRFVTALPIKTDLPSKSAAHNCRGYLVSCIAALLSMYLYVL